MDIIAIIRRFRAPIAGAFIASIIVYVAVVGFGDVLGVDPEFKAQVVTAAKRVWYAGISFLAVVGKRDDNGNGVPDVLEPPSIRPPTLPAKRHVGAPDA